MPDKEHSSNDSKKHRVIHWNPEDDDGGERAKDARVKWLISGAIAIAAIVTIAGVGIYAVNSLKDSNDEVQAIAQSLGVLEADPGGGQNLQEAFVSSARAQFAEENVTRKIEAARSMPTGHDILTQKIITIEKEYLTGENLMQRSSYAKAILQFDKVNTLIDEFTEEVEAKQTSREVYDNFLVNVEELEANKELNEEAYDLAFEAAGAGKRFLDEGSFTAARKKLDEASAHLVELEAAVQNAIMTNAAQGHQYILKGRANEAVEAFLSVLRIDPNNQDAVIHLERAKTADQVYALLQAGGQSESRDELEEALESYQQAFGIDGQSAMAQQSVSRVRRLIQERDFAYHYNSALKAIEQNQYEPAIEHYQAALAIFPHREDIAQSIEKARIDKRNNDIFTMISRAYAYEEEHQWQEARGIYMKLIELEGELDAAKEGLLRTGKMIRSILRYEKLVEVATLEARSLEFQDAIRTFDKAMQSKPAYLALSDEAENLRRFLQVQSRRVPVTIISDAETWVSLQGPETEKPQKLKQKVFNLLPGKYKIVGRKRDHESVSINLQIRGSSRIEPITVIAAQRRSRR